MKWIIDKENLVLGYIKGNKAKNFRWLSILTYILESVGIFIIIFLLFFFLGSPQ